ncbi:hypothetical protein BD413DRAFT_448556, partial [Trametes elegans]
PFNKPPTDHNVRTSDSVGFRTHMWILSDASPASASIFNGAGRAESPTRDMSAAPAYVVDVAEPSSTFGPLLRMCDPLVDTSSFATVNDLKPIVATARKY